MAKEIEINVGDVDIEELHGKFASMGIRQFGRYDFRVVNFQLGTRGTVSDEDYHTSWLRLRTDGRKTTMTLKEQSGTGANGREEYEVEVSSFEETVRMLARMLPYAGRNYLERYRELYVYEPKGIEISVDRWPLLPYKMELEGESEEVLKEFFASLHLKHGRIVVNPSVTDEEYYRMFGVDYGKVRGEYARKLEQLLAQGQPKTS